MKETKNFVIAANWKNALNHEEGLSLFTNMFFPSNEPATFLSSPNSEKTKIIVASSFTQIPMFSSFLEKLSKPVNNLSLSSQNLSSFPKGSHTGEICAEHLKKIPFLKYSIVGHSERRHDEYSIETNNSVASKLFQALKHGISPILCVGETLKEREANRFDDVVRDQLNAIEVALELYSMEKIKNCINENQSEEKKQCKCKNKDKTCQKGECPCEENCGEVEIIVAYEPVWAIGTGKVPTKESIEETVLFIRTEIQKIFEKSKGKSNSCCCSDCLHCIRIVNVLYGGSVDDKNCNELLEVKGINGFLIGGASLHCDKMKSIVETVQNIAN